ncbi:MAG: tryptophan--tRNA ligase, partial [Elusimicrobia bacterium]|nr:tryptophan--tRNA ligase [Elusimicrobiota bacterium]
MEQSQIQSLKSQIRRRVFSGIQPSGVLHLGNYLGALKNWVALQKECECLYGIVDLHAITVKQDSESLRRNILATAAVCLAAGVDPKKSALFIQSDVAEHAELAWILNCYTTMGELNRMTQFKDKARKEGGLEGASVGLYDYPVLMAADILLYKAHEVPVGEDQKQHLELSRDIARRFNNFYGEVFRIPGTTIPRVGARIMGLDDPSQKMSKSASSEYNYIGLDDSPETIRKKFKVAATDSEKEVRYDEEKKPAISNLMNIYATATGQLYADIQSRYAGKGYAQFKQEVAEEVIQLLKPIQEKMKYWQNHSGEVEKILHQGAEKARQIAGKTLKEVKEKIGLGLLKQGLGV